ncbi:uncharacterized protein C8R40DRAFT_529797 [Lentinula edodes]|uniref:uncharacterized protein n=1 Tax=Lentinula edodes TaxID=5353 RepID=UPI001E8D78C6|nr:uncharacterized protein C8R40DRAFT_529797 [Lentinula edodes]KAH7871768.1 hypothetical protein C8R40DRAFT_529797 [Lentinula edodes]
MSWFSSWLPSLPSISSFAVPSSIQRRFISFVLKRSLGHLLKPGQLDVEQIDSQIGSGYVQVNDLQLDNNAINSIVSQTGLPLELVDSSLASVTARIPWPNPLTSTLGFSLSSLHVTLRVIPVQESTNHADINLSESVASYAESFIQDELTPREEANLRKSFRYDPSASLHHEPDDENVPGGLNPFRDLSEEEELADMDPDGVSLFATLIERLLAKFEFDATDTKVTILHPQSSRLSLSIADINYRTEAPSNANITDGFECAGESRTVSISGITLSGCDLRPHSAVPLSPDRLSFEGTPSYSLTPRSPSPSSSSSSSSMDEQVQWAMSQSLAFLPPRPGSPASSVASSIYQSAISGHASYAEHTGRIEESLSSPASASKHDLDHVKEADDEVFLSFGVDPIIIKLTTPSLRGRTPSQTVLEELHISMDIGIISCALRPWHVPSVVRLVDAIMPSRVSLTPKPSNASTSPFSLGTDKRLSLNVKAVVVLLLASSSNGASSSFSLGGYFSRPRVPPSLSEGYLRLFLDNLSATASNVTMNSKAPQPDSGSGSQTSTLTFSLSLNEISVFASRLSSNNNEAEVLAFPLMITDPLLPSQHISEHKHPDPSSEFPILLDFDVMDWTTEAACKHGMKPSAWRTKQKQNKASHSSHAPPPGTDRDSLIPVLTVKGERQSLEKPLHKGKLLKNDIRAEFSPLQFFVDLRHLFGATNINSYVDELMSALKSPGATQLETEMNGSGSDNDGDTPPATPRVNRYHNIPAEHEEERRSLEKLVLQDLDLDLDYRQIPTSKDFKHSGAAKPVTRRSQKKNTNVVVQFPFIRTNIRCSSNYNQPSRSGAVVVDIQDLALTNRQIPTSRRTASFESPSSTRRLKPAGNVILTSEFRRLVIASSSAGSPKASVVVSLGHLQNEEASDRPESQALLPRFVLSQFSQALNSTTMITLSLPSLLVSMDKDSFDALQYWADDASQLVQKSSGYSDSDGDTEKPTSRDSSLIGSHYFAKSNTSSEVTSLASNPRELKTIITVQVFVVETFCRIHLPRLAEQPMNIRPFDMMASDIDVSIQIRPEGRDETTATIKLMNLLINDHTGQGTIHTLLSLTKPRDLRLPPQPLLKLRFTSVILPETIAKESRIRLHLWGFTYQLFTDVSWISDITLFANAPPGAFETVVPSERTKITLRVVDGSMKVLAPTHSGALVLHIGDLDFSTDLIGESPELEFMLRIQTATLLAIDDLAEFHASPTSSEGFLFWKKCGFVLLSEIMNVVLSFKALKSTTAPDTRVVIQNLGLRLHLCADTMSAISVFISDLVTALNPTSEHQTPKPKRKPMVISEEQHNARGIMSSVDNFAFKKLPEIGPAPDMIYDDLPRNPDYLDESFGAAGGLRELREEDLNDFDDEEVIPTPSSDEDINGVVSRLGGETIRILRPEGLQLVESHFDSLPPITENSPTNMGDTTLHVEVHNADINVFLYDGYDWSTTRRTIENEVKEMRKRLAKIRQLVAKGQTQQFAGEETSALLFNSVYIGLKEDTDELDSNALIAAIDEELKEDIDTVTESSWQSLPVPSQPKTSAPATRLNGKRLARAKSPSIEFRISGLDADIAQYHPDDPLVSRVFATMKDLEILDHIKSSTWKKFLTALRSDSRGNVRETDSNMVKVELRTVRPVVNDPSEEARLKAKILPLRLHVDQDALDFLKKFFSFTDPTRPSTPTDPDGGIYFQLAEIFPVDLKLDYKPRRVDYRALKEGKTIELMNFFHFDGAEMTLRHITLSGITGWPRLGELLNDLWTPDVKATQLVDVISGVAPIRSVVNVGSGIADLVLLPIAQYKKDGRIVRGVQKGTTAFVKSTAIEAIKLGAKLATGTQVILEQAEGVLGPQFKYPITTETLRSPNFGDDLLDIGFGGSSDEEENALDLISKYADQPTNVKEGVQSAYKSLQRNLNSAAQTILAVPMEVYERSGNEGPVRSVIRAVPIAVLKPMIGASEAVSKTLLGLHNTLDPNLRHENDAKYKHR